MRSNRAEPFLPISCIAADTCEAQLDSQTTNAAGIVFINGNYVDNPLVDEPAVKYQGAKLRFGRGITCFGRALKNLSAKQYTNINGLLFLKRTVFSSFGRGA